MNAQLSALVISLTSLIYSQSIAHPITDKLVIDNSNGRHTIVIKQRNEIITIDPFEKKEIKPIKDDIGDYPVIILNKGSLRYLVYIRKVLEAHTAITLNTANMKEEGIHLTQDPDPYLKIERTLLSKL